MKYVYIVTEGAYHEYETIAIDKAFQSLDVAHDAARVIIESHRGLKTGPATPPVVRHWSGGEYYVEIWQLPVE